MAYRLKPGRTIERDLRRIVSNQLLLAMHALEITGEPLQTAASRDARRHIKKIRAALRLIQPTLDSRYRRTIEGLKTASRLLSPIADDDAVLATMERVAAQYGHSLSTETVDAIRRRLAQEHRRITRKAQLARVMPAARELLAAEGERVRHWQLSKRGFRAIAPGLEKSIREARRAMARALEHPTIEHYHAWRRRAKSLWLQVRLLDGRCGGKLAPLERRLEALDGCLGEYHNVALLEKALTDDAPASRQETARCLRLVRRYQAGLRRDARRLGAAVRREHPTALVRRVKRYWRHNADAVPTTTTAVSRRRSTNDDDNDTAAARRLLSGIGEPPAGPWQTSGPPRLLARH